MKKPPALGSINARVSSAFRFDGNWGTFDGTTKDLVIQAAKLGAVAESLVQANYGGLSLALADVRLMRIIAAPHDDRAGGLWAEHVNG